MRQNGTMSETVFEAQLDVATALSHNVAPPTKLLTLPVSQCGGFVLAQEVNALTDLPPFAASKVDGWAVSGAGPWKIQGSNLAGSVSESELTDQQCIHIATGAALPLGTTGVLKDEDSEVIEDLVTAKSSAGLKNIRPRGVEALSGDVLIEAGVKLTAPLLGLAAASGYDELTIYQKPTVEVLIFGDELIHSGLPGESNNANGKVRDSIGPQIENWLADFGAQLVGIKYVADNLPDHIDAITGSTADLIITTGGTANGPVDYLHSAIKECQGTLLIDAVLVRPGYHQLLAQLPDRFLIGLPGNPQSAVVGLFTLVEPFLKGATVQNIGMPKFRTLAVDVAAPEKEFRFLLAREISGTVGQIEPVNHLDSSMLRGFVDSDGFAVIEPGGQLAGSQVRWHQFIK